MQSPRTFGLSTALAALITLGAGAPGTSQDTKTPEAKKASGLLGALPKDTLFLVHVPSAGSLVEKGKRSPLYKLKDHPEVKGLLAKLASEIEKGTAGAKEKLGIDPLELLGSFQGEVTLAFGSLKDLADELQQALSMGREPSPKPESLPLLLAGDAGSSSAKVKEQLSKLYGYLEKEGMRKTESEFRGGRILVFKGEDATKNDASKGKEKDKDKDGDEDEDSKGKGKDAMTLCVGELGNHIFLSPSRKFLEDCMSGVAAPRAESIGDNTLYTATMKSLPQGGDLNVYLDIKQLTTAIGRALSSSFVGFYWQKVESLILGKSLNNFGASVHVEEKQVREAFFVHNGGAADGLVGLVKGDAFPPSPPAFMPEKAHTFASVAFNPATLEKLLREVAEVAMTFQAGAGTDVDQMFEQQVGVKLKDLFASLGKRFHVFAQDVPGGNAVQGIDVAVELKDDGPVRQLLQKQAQGDSAAVSVTRYKEKDIFSLNPGAGGTAITLVEKHLLLSQAVERIQSMVDRLAAGGAGKPAAIVEEYGRMSKGVPPAVSLLYFVSEAAMKSQVRGVADQIPTDSEDDAKQVRAALNAISDILGASITFGAWRDTGLYVEEIYSFTGK